MALLRTVDNQSHPTVYRLNLSVHLASYQLCLQIFVPIVFEIVVASLLNYSILLSFTLFFWFFPLFP